MWHSVCGQVFVCNAVQDVVVQYGLFVAVRDRILWYSSRILRLDVAMPWQLFS